ncbi:MAG TPA: EpsG family protein [Novosphingobium sp.]|nr:EpsG family protein [Novosphingobium sp.]
MVLSPWRGTPGLQRMAWVFFGVLFTLMIGLRYQVGADWEAYLWHYDVRLGVPLSEAIGASDPGYALLNWLSGLVGGQVYLVNLVCGAFVMAGVIVFSRRQPLPWLALLVAVPYMIMVVAMGYTRQSVAMGFELLALVALMDGRMRRFVLLVASGALFHMSALVLLPLAMLAGSRNRLWTLVWVGLTGAGIGLALLTEHYELLWLNYVEAEMVSEGGGIRVAMNALPAILLLLFRKKLAPDDDERRLWVWMAVFALACIPLIGLASTAVDRMALYFMPIQLYVFSRVHRLFGDQLFKTVAVVGVVLGYGMVQWVWLNYATHAFAWLPYQFYPLINL